MLIAHRLPVATASRPSVAASRPRARQVATGGASRSERGSAASASWIASARTRSVIGIAIMCACRSANRKVKNGNSVIAGGSSSGCGMARLAFQNHQSLGNGQLTSARPILPTPSRIWPSVGRWGASSGGGPPPICPRPRASSETSVRFPTATTSTAPAIPQRRRWRPRSTGAAIAALAGVERRSALAMAAAPEKAPAAVSAKNMGTARL